MIIKHCIHTRQRHADNFTDGQVVFETDRCKVIVKAWNEKGRNAFRVYVNGREMGATSNLPKAIGMGVMMSCE